MNKKVTLNFDPRKHYPDEIEVSHLHSIVSEALTADNEIDMSAAASQLMEIQSRSCRHIAKLCDIAHDIDLNKTNPADAVAQTNEIVRVIDFLARVGMSCAAVNDSVERCDKYQPKRGASQ